MIDIVTDLREQADRYEADAWQALQAEPTPLPDLETVRAQLAAQLADVDRRIRARQVAERRHGHLMGIARELAALADRHAAETPPPPGEALARTGLTGGHPLPPSDAPVAGHAVMETRPQEVPPPPGGAFPAAEDVVDGPGETGPQDGGVTQEGQQ